MDTAGGTTHDVVVAGGGDRPDRSDRSDRRVRRVRRLVFVGLIVLQVFMVVRAYWAPHMEFGYHMFSESSDWQAEIVRVTTDGSRRSIETPWSGYEWNSLVSGRGLSSPWRRHHANGGIDSQIAYLGEALDWVAANTPNDPTTRYLEARVTVWHNADPPRTITVRSTDRPLP